MQYETVVGTLARFNVIVIETVKQLFVLRLCFFHISLVQDTVLLVNNGASTATVKQPVLQSSLVKNDSFWKGHSLDGTRNVETSSPLFPQHLTVMLGGKQLINMSCPWLMGEACLASNRLLFRTHQRWASVGQAQSKLLQAPRGAQGVNV